MECVDATLNHGKKRALALFLMPRGLSDCQVVVQSGPGPLTVSQYRYLKENLLYLAAFIEVYLFLFISFYFQLLRCVV